MRYFQPEFLQFFIDLAPNNHKDWFDQNRNRYKKFVKEPFKVFVSDLIERLGQHNPQLKIEPKHAIFRINRDIRFSKDKTPYKMHVAAALAPGGKKDHDYPGIYVHLSPEKMLIYFGLFNPSRELRDQVRVKIANERKRFQDISQSPTFVEAFGEIEGDKNKIVAKEVKKQAQKEPMIYNKSWLYGVELPPETVLRDDLLDLTENYFKLAEPLMKFFVEAKIQAMD
jgi:uncharacterized protein (TIGR02453 family)